MEGCRQTLSLWYFQIRTHIRVSSCTSENIPEDPKKTIKQNYRTNENQQYHYYETIAVEWAIDQSSFGF